LGGSGVGGGGCFFGFGCSLLFELLDFLSDMTNTQESQQTHDTHDISNIKLIYKYTEATINNLGRSIDNVNTRLAGLLAANGVLLRFSSDLASSEFWLKVTKIGATGCLVISVFYILTALMPSADGDVPRPYDLRHGDYYYANEEDYRVFIVDRWIKAEKQFIEKYNRKASSIEKTYILIGMAAILFGLNIFVNTICGNP
jgi:hypothetical protein